MSEIWYAIPTADIELCTKTFSEWKQRGYKTAALIDGDSAEPGNADLVIRVEKYGGYGASVNRLCTELRDVEWVVTGGDDTTPDPHADPNVIASECNRRFRGTFGVMQPVGDRWLNNCIVYFAGSPWLGRDFRNRINRGKGPFWEEYRHYYDDTELMNRAMHHKCFWQRNDLTHTHMHWTRRGVARPPHLIDKMPLEGLSKLLFLRREAAGFPGSDLLDQ